MMLPDVSRALCELRAALRVPGARQQALLLRAGAALVFCLLMLNAALPAQRWLGAQREAHREARALLSRVAALPRQPAAVQPPDSAVTAPSLVAVVNQTAPEFDLVFGDFRPEGDARLALDLRGADFDALLGWLASLERQHGIGVSAVDVRPTDTPGRVDVRLTVMRSPLLHGAQQ
jgi:type II secretory pathway component PulM